MRILFLASDPALGPEVPFGDSIRVRLLLETLRRLGHDVAVRWSGPAPPPGAVAPAPERPLPDVALQLVRDARSLRRAARFRRRLAGVERPDLVFEFAAYLTPVGVPLARRFDVPYAVEVEGPLAQLRYERSGSPLRPLGDLLERKRLRDADVVLTVSQPLADHLVALGARRERTRVVPNVADAARFRPDGERRRALRARLEVEDKIVVGFHGVFSPWYRLGDLVEALAIERDPRLSLLLVGDGVEREQVERLARERGLEADVHVTGFVPHDEVPAYVDAFDVAVLPDHVWWTSPLKLFEYGAMEKPVVAPDVASVRGLAADGELLLVEPGRLEELAAALRSLADDPVRREQLADRWSSRVARDYTAERLGEGVAEAVDLALRR